MWKICAPPVEVVFYAFGVQQVGKVHIPLQAEIGIAGNESDIHLPVAFKKPRIVHVREIVHGIIEIAKLVIVAVQQPLDIERAIHCQQSMHKVGMFQREVCSLVGTEADAERYHRVHAGCMPQIRKKLMHKVVFESHSDLDLPVGFAAIVVPSLPMQAVDAQYLDMPSLDLIRQDMNHPPIGKFVVIA